MKNIDSGWGVGISYFYRFYAELLNAYGEGVSQSGNCIFLDNASIKGTIEFCFLDNKMSLIRFNLSFSETVCFARRIHASADYYACFFYFKEGMFPRVFDNASQLDTELSRMLGNGYVQYFSADVATLLKASSNEQIRGAIVVFTADALSSIRPMIDTYQNFHLFNGRTTKGSISMGAAMSDILTDLLLDHDKNFHSLYMLGGVYRLLSLLMIEIESK
ncbi:hypothetical protein QEG73_01250 [Chitinophagaceae bacterium 26-R-25]|nr:hypothetical protein [Chitinophagaceae bacterium 26-R-25]